MTFVKHGYDRALGVAVPRERRMASRIAKRSAGRDERVTSGRLIWRGPHWGVGGRARHVRASVGVEASHLRRKRGTGAPSAGVSVFLEAV